MILKRAIIKKFRNLTDVEISFSKKSLVIGANDVGKTNLMDALRILLDKNLSEADLVPKDEDFCAFNECNSFEITLEFTDIIEDCIYSKLAEYINEESQTMFLSYEAIRDGIGGKKDYKFKAGYTLDSLEEIPGRHYLKVLNLKYVSATRQVDAFLRNQKTKLLEMLMSNRSPEEESGDDSQWLRVNSLRDEIQGELDSLSYIQSAGNKINEELKQLAEHHNFQEMKLGVDVPNESELFRRLKLLSFVNEIPIQVGGDGRKNQAFIALWAAMNKIQKQDGQPDEVSILCIEEPESNLHPHQQRKLSEYLVHKFDSQVILTSHSPFIATDFMSDSIIRLYSQTDKSTVVASKGASREIAERVDELEFRLNVFSTEVYFSDCVLLVEGSSEVIFYKALAGQIGVDLDKLNISILSVEGVGFERYIRLFQELGIPCVIRTDNDYFKIPRNPTYRLAGVQRCIKAIKVINEINNFSRNEIVERLCLALEDKLTALPNPCDDHRKTVYELVHDDFQEFKVFIAQIGLEEDLLYQSHGVKQCIYEYFSLTEEHTYQDALEEMKDKKSTFMYHFVKQHRECLSTLRDCPIAEPLLECEKIIGGLRSGEPV
ncbi:ATP-dependent endonuclease [Bacillus cereus]|uniref:ATP-dependent nuclease n=1 Tax=Bacillus cereus TaxID=1396 RepID=UPI0011A6DC0C|nr:AAA family ATPase [Bacillus cereus]